MSEFINTKLKFRLFSAAFLPTGPKLKLYLGGYKDWRLPNLKELESIVDLGRINSPIIDTTYFPNAEWWGYWSSTTAAARYHAWPVFFNSGAADHSQHKADIFYVRAVRGGQSGPFLPVADFQATHTSGVAPLTVQFTDLSTGSIDGWLWDFGDGQTSTQQNPNHTYNTPGNYTVALEVTAPGGSDTETKFNYIKVAYYSNFDDVPPGYWAEEFINKIYENGITSGCSQEPLMYCPEDTVTRAQMAVFLERGINGSDYSPPGATGVFDDCPVGYWAASWVEQFYADGITGGCSTNPPLYCPDDNVTRAQMAVFLLRSMYGSSYKPPSATGIFDDVPVTYWAAPWIEQLYAEGITGGCSSNPPLYCPDDTVTRAQMAVFIVRAFDL